MFKEVVNKMEKSVIKAAIWYVLFVMFLNWDPIFVAILGIINETSNFIASLNAETEE